MKKSKLQLTEDVELIRRLTVRAPGITNIKIRELTGFSFDYIQKIHKSIEDERIKKMRSMSKESLYYEVSRIEEVFTEIEAEMWQILNNKGKWIVRENKQVYVEGSKPSEVMKAGRVITELMERLFKLKLDSGYFEAKEQFKDNSEEIREILSEFAQYMPYGEALKEEADKMLK